MEFNNITYQSYMSLAIKTSDDELMPTRANSTDAGLDLKAKQDYKLYVGIRTLVGTGVSVQIPKGFVGLLIPRSSLSKSGIEMTNSVGVIDSGYRGEIMASLKFVRSAHEHLEQSIQIINKYDRIVQLLIIPIELAEPVRWEGSDEDWNDSERGMGGFGSTGK